jgi:phosphopantothenoylcysteine decarboxylase/phosphopantothenate--cysteine ligase
VTLLKNPDILKEAGLWKKKKRSNKPILVGFALETTRLQTAAARKLKEKNLDLIIGNSPASFSNSLIKPYWLERGEKGRSLPRMSKKNLSSRIANWIETKLK